MTSFLGPVGSLVPVACPSQLTSSGGRPVSFQDTLGARKAFLGRVRARTWNVGVGLASPGDLSALRWLAEYTGGPMVWFPSDAVVGNILTPDVAGLISGTHNGLEGALVEVESGVWVKSAHPDGDLSLRIPRRQGGLDALPVVPGLSVTVGAWVRGSGRITVFWQDATGTSIGSSAGPNVSHSTLTRISRTVTPPAGAVSMEIRFVGVSQIAGPTVTFTDTLLPYSPGRGAFRVVAHGLTDAVLRATEDQQHQSLSFTVSEVG